MTEETTTPPIKKNLFGNLLKIEGFYKASTIVDELNAIIPQRNTLYSTSPSLSWLSGGFIPGMMSLWYGPKSSGKTMLTLDLIKNALNQEPDGIVVYVDAEMSFEKEPTIKWMIANGVDVSRVMLLREICIKEIFDVKILKDIQLSIKNDGTKVIAIVLDSVQATSMHNLPNTDKQILNADYAKQDFGARANYLSRIFPQLRAFCRNYNVHFFFIGQARSGGKDFYGNEIIITTGGEALQHEIQYKFLITPDGEPIFHETDKDADGKFIKVGHQIKIVCLKNKVSEGQDKVGWVKIKYMQGIVDTESELVDICTKLNIVNTAGAWLSYSDKKWNGAAKMAEYLKEDQLMYRELYNKMLFRMG
jgi:RecA/RadA recombinase